MTRTIGYSASFADGHAAWTKGKRRAACFASAAALLLASSSAGATTVVNGGFESGDLSGWTLTDNAWGGFPPNLPMGSNVYGAGMVAPGGWPFFHSAPSEGSYAFLNVFDGPPSIIRLAQNVMVTSAGSLAFDYRAAWAFGVIATANQDRDFVVNIRSGGVDHPVTILTAQHGHGGGWCTMGGCNAPPGTPGVVLDTGLLHGSVDLTPFVGEMVSLMFEWHIPEPFTGPGFFQLDNIRADGGAVPEPTVLALLGLGLAGLAARRRRKL
jgi:hypothetical protein